MTVAPRTAGKIKRAPAIAVAATPIPATPPATVAPNDVAALHRQPCFIPGCRFPATTTSQLGSSPGSGRTATWSCLSPIIAAFSTNGGLAVAPQSYFGTLKTITRPAQDGSSATSPVCSEQG